MNPRSFFSELKRRNVYKVAITYAVVAWLLVQVGSILFPTFEVPSWVMKVYITAIAAGFPVALVMAWAFELTPQGLKRTEVADAAQGHSARGGWIAVIVITTALSLGLFLLVRYTASQAASRERGVATQRSVAVLPFENLSDDKSNAYFATGIQDEILIRLARLNELKVILRTFNAEYKSKSANTVEFGKHVRVQLL